MSATAYRKMYRDELRRAILDAARPLFVHEGYERFSMRKLAEKVHCSHGNLYTYFTSKQQLFDCLMEDSFTQLGEALRRLQQTVPQSNPVRLLKEAGKAYISFGLKNAKAYEFAFIIRRTGPAGDWKRHATFDFLRSIVQRCIEEKFFRPADVDTTAQAMWAAVHGVTALLILRPSFPWVARAKLIHQVVDSAVDSMRIHARATPSSRLHLVHPHGNKR